MRGRGLAGGGVELGRGLDVSWYFVFSSKQWRVQVIHLERRHQSTKESARGGGALVLLLYCATPCELGGVGDKAKDPKRRIASQATCKHLIHPLCI